MSSLFADITLDFEALADDPIEQGIRYGKNILHVLSDKVAEPKKQFTEMIAKYQPVIQPKPLSSYKPRLVVATPARVSTERRSNFRRDYESLATRAYTQRRELVGSL